MNEKEMNKEEFEPLRDKKHYTVLNDIWFVGDDVESATRGCIKNLETLLAERDASELVPIVKDTIYRWYIDALTK